MGGEQRDERRHGRPDPLPRAGVCGVVCVCGAGVWGVVCVWWCVCVCGCVVVLCVVVCVRVVFGGGAGAGVCVRGVGVCVRASSCRGVAVRVWWCVRVCARAFWGQCARCAALVVEGAGGALRAARGVLFGELRPTKKCAPTLSEHPPSTPNPPTPHPPTPTPPPTPHTKKTTTPTNP